MFSYLQKIGKALMVPVAVLPAAAIMLGLGNWMGGKQSISSFLNKSRSSSNR